MSADDTMVFDNFDGVTGRPTIDGFATHDPGVLTTEAEPGYVNGGRMTVGSGDLPPVIIQTVKDGNTLVLGITCRGNTSFDDLDGVVVGLRPNGSASAGPQRRIDIFPVWGDAPFPLDPTNLGTGYGAADPDPMNPGAHLVAPPNGDPLFDVRTDKPVHIGPVFYQRGGSSGNWTQYTPALGSNPAIYHIRVRSYKPDMGSGSPEEFAWSMEIRIPIDSATGGADWIDLDDDFGLFVDVIRAGRMVEPMFGDGVYFSTQFLFPLAAPDLPDILDATTNIPAASFGHGLMNAATANGEGVRILNGAAGIGRRAAGSPNGTPLTNTISGIENNEIVANIENSGPAASNVFAEVRMANWGLGPPVYAAWNKPPGIQDPSPSINLAAGTLASPGVGNTVNTWTAASVAATDYAVHTHQCMWVQLDSTSGSVNFARSSTRRNMNFVDLSGVEHEAEVSGKGYEKPKKGETHEFVMFTRCRKIVVKQLLDRVREQKQGVDPETVALVGGALNFAANVPSPKVEPNEKARANTIAASRKRDETQWDESVVYLWINEGFRRTNRHFEVQGIKTEVLDNRPGQFGLIAHHQGVNDNLSWSFEGDGIARFAPGAYILSVPHDGVLKLKTTLSAERGGPKGDNSQGLPTIKPGGGKPGLGNEGGGNGGKPEKGGCLGLLLVAAAVPAILLGATWLSGVS